MKLDDNMSKCGKAVFRQEMPFLPGNIMNVQPNNNHQRNIVLEQNRAKNSSTIKP